MKIKQSTFYALRLIYRMYTEESEVVTSVELAEKEEISKGVTMKILRKLARVGMMEVRQGRGKICGGFSLARSIDEITLLEVITVFEGLDICINIGDPVCSEKEKLLWTCSCIDEQIKEVFLEYTIRDLFEPEEKRFFESKKEQDINTFQVVI